MQRTNEHDFNVATGAGLYHTQQGREPASTPTVVASNSWQSVSNYGSDRLEALCIVHRPWRTMPSEWMPVATHELEFRLMIASLHT